MSNALSRSSIRARDRVVVGSMHRGQVLIAERQVVEVDGEFLPIRLLTIEAGSPKGERSAGRARRKPFAR